MDETVTVDGLTYETSQKNDIKFMTVKRKSDGQIIKSQVGRPVLIDKKFSISVNLGDITKGVGIGGSFGREKTIQYEWTQIAVRQPYMNKENQQVLEPLVRTPEYIQEIDSVTENLTGAPFAKKSQTLFTGAPIKADDFRIDVSASSCPVLTLKTKENKWLNSWSIGYYLFNLIRRYDTVDTLDLLIPNDIRGEFGYTTIKLLAETGTKIRLLTNSSIKEIHFSDETNTNLILNGLYNYRQTSVPLPQLGYSMIINGKEVHAEKLNENIFSDDPLMISDIQSDFNSLWAASETEKQRINQSETKKPSPRRRIR